MNEFINNIRTTQVEGGGFYIETTVPINGEVSRYGQHYSSDETKPTYAKDLAEAVERFKNYYYPLYLQDKEA